MRTLLGSKHKPFPSPSSLPLNGMVQLLHNLRARRCCWQAAPYEKAAHRPASRPAPAASPSPRLPPVSPQLQRVQITKVHSRRSLVMPQSNSRPQACRAAQPVRSCPRADAPSALESRATWMRRASRPVRRRHRVSTHACVICRNVLREGTWEFHVITVMQVPNRRTCTRRRASSKSLATVLSSRDWA